MTRQRPYRKPPSSALRRFKPCGNLGDSSRRSLAGSRRTSSDCCGGDYIEYRRLSNLAALKVKYHKRLADLGVTKTMPPRLTLALPIFQAAADESNSELQELWARLLAAAMDPDRAKLVRQSFIDIVKKMDPIDARVLRHVHKNANDRMDNGAINNMAQQLAIGDDELLVTRSHLEELKLVAMSLPGSYTLSPIGREFLRAVGE